MARTKTDKITRQIREFEKRATICNKYLGATTAKEKLVDDYDRFLRNVDDLRPWVKRLSALAKRIDVFRTSLDALKRYPTRQSRRRCCMKKLFVARIGEGRQNPKKTLPAKVCGYYRNIQGVIWTVFTPTLNDLSSWVRLEAPGKRTCFVYDAGWGFRRCLFKRKPVST